MLIMAQDGDSILKCKGLFAVCLVWDSYIAGQELPTERAKKLTPWYIRKIPLSRPVWKDAIIIGYGIIADNSSIVAKFNTEEEVRKALKAAIKIADTGNLIDFSEMTVE